MSDTLAATFPTDAEADAAAVEAGRRLFAQACTFIAGATIASALPPDSLTEIAFIGRSNVGKSSLVNALAGQNALARVSRTPGRTRQINFFDLGGRLMLVDLPGYGFASAPKHEIARWTELIGIYLKGRASLRRALLLIDSRHGIKETDRPLMKLLDGAAVSYQIVLTKVDTLKKPALDTLLAETAAELAQHVAAHPVIALTSAQTGFGIAALRGALGMLAGPAEAR